jgi:hypothetical protein
MWLLPRGSESEGELWRGTSVTKERAAWGRLRAGAKHRLVATTLQGHDSASRTRAGCPCRYGNLCLRGRSGTWAVASYAGVHGQRGAVWLWRGSGGRLGARRAPVAECRECCCVDVQREAAWVGRALNSHILADSGRECFQASPVSTLPEVRIAGELRKNGWHVSKWDKEVPGTEAQPSTWQ